VKILFILDHATFQDDYLTVAKAAAPYADMIWYRFKSGSSAMILSRAKKLREILPDSTLILSERADIATMAGFNGVHLNSRSIPPSVIKGRFPNLIVGYSAHSVAECHVAADYITLSPIFHTEKPYTVHPLGAIDAPAANVYALGGISIDNIAQLAGKGYAGVAGISLYKDVERFAAQCKFM
jgi:thiamine-phosphate pyrophosphorylase